MTNLFVAENGLELNALDKLGEGEKIGPVPALKNPFFGRQHLVGVTVLGIEPGRILVMCLSSDRMMITRYTRRAKQAHVEFLSEKYKSVNEE